MAAKTMEEIASTLNAIKFKKKFIGGVNEDDVWRVLEKLQADYRSVVEATEQRYTALLNDRNNIIRKQQKQLSLLQVQRSSFEGGTANG